MQRIVGWQRRLVALVAGLVIGAALIPLPASAAPKSVSKLAIPKGSTVQRLNNSSVSMRTKSGIAGTYTCRCSGDKGTCTVSQSEGVLACGRSGDSCTGACSMETTTGGIKARRATAAGGVGAVKAAR